MGETKWVRVEATQPSEAVADPERVWQLGMALYAAGRAASLDAGMLQAAIHLRDMKFFAEIETGRGDPRSVPSYIAGIGPGTSTEMGWHEFAVLERIPDGTFTLRKEKRFKR